MTGSLSEDIKYFILEYIDSVAQIEMLILLLEVPDKKWEAEAISQELRSNPDYVSDQLANLKRKGLVQNGEGRLYSYGATDPRIDKIARTLPTVYGEKRVSIINLIYNKPSELIQGLADAFKVRKEDKDG